MTYRKYVKTVDSFSQFRFWLTMQMGLNFNEKAVKS